MSLTAKEVNDKVQKFDEERSSERYETVYQNLHDGEYGDKKNTVEVPGLPTLKYVDSYGGEGQGDAYWVVFSVDNQFFRIDGWYASYDGGELDGELYEVFPEEVTKTVYLRKK